MVCILSQVIWDDKKYIKWFVMSNTVELSDAQVDAFRKIYRGNYRPVLPFNDRVFNPSPVVEVVAPVVMPETGGLAFPWEGVLMGVGVLTSVAGLYLHRRKIA
jgi:hypothetical protein